MNPGNTSGHQARQQPPTHSNRITRHGWTAGSVRNAACAPTSSSRTGCTARNYFPSPTPSTTPAAISMAGYMLSEKPTHTRATQPDEQIRIQRDTLVVGTTSPIMVPPPYEARAPPFPYVRDRAQPSLPVFLPPDHNNRHTRQHPMEPATVAEYFAERYGMLLEAHTRGGDTRYIRELAGRTHGGRQWRSGGIHGMPMPAYHPLPIGATIAQASGLSSTMNDTIRFITNLMGEIHMLQQDHMRRHQEAGERRDHERLGRFIHAQSPARRTSSKPARFGHMKSRSRSIGHR